MISAFFPLSSSLLGEVCVSEKLPNEASSSLPDDENNQEDDVDDDNDDDDVDIVLSVLYQRVVGKGQREFPSSLEATSTSSDDDEERAMIMIIVIRVRES